MRIHVLIWFPYNASTFYPPTKAFINNCSHGTSIQTLQSPMRNYGGITSWTAFGFITGTDCASHQHNRKRHFKSSTMHGTALTRASCLFVPNSIPVICLSIRVGPYLYGKNGLSTCSESSDMIKMDEESLKDNVFFANID